MKKIFSEAELMISRLRTWLLIIVFIVTVSLLTVIIIYVYRRQRHEIDQKVLFAGELQEELKQNRKYLDRTMENLDKTKEELAKSNKDLDKTKEDLAKSKMNLDKIKDDLAKSKEELDRTKDDLAKSIEDLDTSKTENKHAFDVIKFLWSTKYELLEQMAEINIYNTSSKMVRQKIADTVTKLIDDFKYHSDKIVELEKDVDLLYDNLFSDFRRDLPNLKDADYRLYLFSILRISNNTITLFLEENNVEAVYNRKRRLKDKIKKLETYIADRYLDYF